MGNIRTFKCVHIYMTCYQIHDVMYIVHVLYMSYVQCTLYIHVPPSLSFPLTGFVSIRLTDVVFCHLQCLHPLPLPLLPPSLTVVGGPLLLKNFLPPSWPMEAPMVILPSGVQCPLHRLQRGFPTISHLAPGPPFYLQYLYSLLRQQGGPLHRPLLDQMVGPQVLLHLQ